MTLRLRPYLIPLLLIILSTGCAKLPFNKKIRVAKSPAAKPYLKADSIGLSDGSAQQKSSWICFSDRINNATQVSISNDMPEKKLAFLEPLFVLKKKGDFVKVAAYNASVNLKETKGLTSKKALKIYGWIPKEKLLLWNGALKETHTSFAVKAITNVAAEEMILKPEKYFSNDSLLLFSTPDLTQAVPAKIAVGQLAYIYKISADKKSYLLGNAPFFTPDSIKQVVTGWISVNAVSVWGTGAAFTYKKLEAGDTARISTIGLYTSLKDSVPALPIKSLEERTAFENIFPIKNAADSGNIRTAYLGNVLDYSRNKVLNVLGKPVWYNKYKEILRNNTHLNVVFVIDGGASNRLYLPSVKSALQDLQLYFDTTSYFKTTKFGAVIYKQTKCNADTGSSVQPLTGQYGDVIKFIQDKERRTDCADENVYQPVSNAIANACSLLGNVKNETNVIIIVGTTGDDFNHTNISSVSSAISRVQARLMFFQTIGKSADAYNDFILAAEKTVISSSQNIAELKKEKLVNQEDVIPDASYSLQAGDSGIYFLDYPTKSMVQGFVLYPKKGEVMPSGMLKKNFDSLLHQIIIDNRKITRSLRTYFKSNIGINNTEIYPQFHMFPGVKNPVPTEFVKAIINNKNNFFIPAYAPLHTGIPDSIINYGVLLTEAEYDRIAFYFNKIYKSSGAGKEKFRRKRGVRNYIGFMRSYLAKHGDQSRKIKTANLTASEALKLFTGYAGKTDSLIQNMTLGNLKASKKIDDKSVLVFFNQFKYAADAMIENKNAQDVRINCNGQYYYWVDKKLMP